MNKFIKNRLCCGVASLALISFAPSAWGMEDDERLKQGWFLLPKDGQRTGGEWIVVDENTNHLKITSGGAIELVEIEEDFFIIDDIANNSKMINERYRATKDAKQSAFHRLVSHIFPPMQGNRIMTRTHQPTHPTLCMGRVIELEGNFCQYNTTSQMSCIPIERPQDWPHSAHGIIQATFPNDNKILRSGTLIAPNLVLTAAETLCNNKGIRATQVTFYPGINGQITYFEEQNVKDNFYFPEEYKNDPAENYGLLVLEKPIGEITGYFGISVLPPEEIRKLKLHVTGYADDREEKTYKMCTTGIEPTSFNRGLIDYPMVNSWNPSGAGVWYKDDNGNPYVAAVSLPSNGISTFKLEEGLSEEPSSYTATLLTKARYDKIREWVKDAFSKIDLSTCTEEMFSSVDFVDLTGAFLNRFGNTDIDVLCSYAPYLHTAVLSFNSIDDKGFEPFLQHPTLTKLDVSNNYITLNDISEELFKNSKLVSLDLSWNQVNHNGAMLLTHMLNLEELVLSNNKITNAGKALCSFAKSTTLKILDFSNPYNISILGKTVAGVGNAAGKVGTVVGVVAASGTTYALVSTATTGAIAAVALQGIVATGGTAALTPLIGEAVLNGGIITKGLELILGQIGAQMVNSISFYLGYNKAWEVGETTYNSLSTCRNTIGSQFMQWEGKFVIGEEEARALSQNTTLSTLKLSDTGVTSEIVRMLAQSPSITSLDLSWNDLKKEDTQKIHSILHNNTVLTYVNFTNNPIHDSQFQRDVDILLNYNKALSLHSPLFRLSLSDYLRARDRLRHK